MYMRKKKDGLKYQNFYKIKEISIQLRTDSSHWLQNNKNIIKKNFKNLNLLPAFLKGIYIFMKFRYSNHLNSINSNRIDEMFNSLTSLPSQQILKNKTSIL